MKKYICWYAYRGMETEGHTRLEEPFLTTAKNKAEALYKYNCYQAWIKNSEPYLKSLTEHMKSDFNDGGWGNFVMEIEPNEVFFINSFFEQDYNEKWNK